MAIAVTVQGQTEFTRDEISELRIRTLKALAVLLLGVSVGLTLVIGYSPGPWEARAAPLFFGLLLTTALVFISSTRNVTAASVIFLGCCMVDLILADSAFRRGVFVASFPLLAVIAGHLLGWRGAVGSGLVRSAVVLALSVVTPSLVSPGTAATTVFLLVVATGVGWILVWPFQDAITWSWMSYEQALQKTREAQARQTDLARVSKNLSDAYERLEAANGELERARSCRGCPWPQIRIRDHLEPRIAYAAQLDH